MTHSFSTRNRLASILQWTVGAVALALLFTGCLSSDRDGEAQPTDLEWSPPSESEWTALFDGESLDAWSFRSEVAKEIWQVTDGVIDCSPRVLPRDADKDLWTQQEYEDFQVRLEWRIKDTKGGTYEMHPINEDGTYETNDQGEPVTIQRRNADSGVYLRGTPKAQVNIWNWPVGSGEVYGYRTDESMPAEVRAGVTPRLRADRPLGEWNTFLITMEDDRLTVVLNGETVLENARLPDVPDAGPIALQHHGGYDAETDTWSAASSLVQFRDIYVREL